MEIYKNCGDREIFFHRAVPENFKTVVGAALGLLAASGVIALSVLAPNLLMVIGHIFSARRKHGKILLKEKSAKVSKAIYYLKKHGYIRMTRHGQDWKIFLTSFGFKRLRQLNINSLQVPRPKKWDENWWQVAADIPTKEFRRAADAFREKLKQMHFYSLQRSLWFYPYDPRAEVDFIIKHYQIGRFVTVMEVSRLDLDDDKKMREYFRKIKII